MAFGRLAGTAYVAVDGTQIALQGGLTINPASVVREPMVGMDGPHGYKETPMMPSIDLTFTPGPDSPISVVQNVRNATITAEMAYGKTFVLSEAFRSGELSYNAAEGACSVTFHGRSMAEI